MIDVYLDDMRPCPEGWVLADTIQLAKHFLKNGIVGKLSLDHDMGACEACLEAVPDLGYRDGVMPSCEHVGTGYDLVCWMEETGHWPREKPTVHSFNPVGRARMMAVIDKYYKPENG